MDNQFDILETDYTICNDKWSVKNSVVTYNRVYYIVGGEAYCTIGEKKFRLEKGCLYIFPSMNCYTLEHNPKNPLEILWFHLSFRNDFITQMKEIKIPDELSPFIQSLIYLNNHDKNIGDIIKVLDIFIKILSRENKIIDNTTIEMREILNYIDKNISSGLTVNKLADFCKMERSYFCRYFKRKFSMTPQDYIISRKIYFGAVALSQGKSVYEASIESGYQDEKAFSRAFKKNMYTSASKYKSLIVKP